MTAKVDYINANQIDYSIDREELLKQLKDAEEENFFLLRSLENVQHRREILHNKNQELKRIIADQRLDIDFAKNAIHASGFEARRLLDNAENSMRLADKANQNARKAKLEAKAAKENNIVAAGKIANLQSERAVLKNIIAMFLNSHPKKFKTSKKVRHSVKVLRDSLLFDPDYYISTYPDVSQSSGDPVEHYVLFGWAEFRNPSIFFNTLYYLKNNADIIASGANPLVHFLEYGWKELRSPCPAINLKVLSNKNPSLFSSDLTVFELYIRNMETETTI